MCFVDICKQMSYNVNILDLEVNNMANKKLIISTKKYSGESAVVSARLPLDLIQKIDDICDLTNRNKNEVIQLCIEFAVENIELEK